jgi:hypothetical protein
MPNITAAINEVWQVKAHYTLEQQEVLNVMHFQAPAGDTDVWVHLLAVIGQCIITSLLPGLTPGLRFEKLTAMKVAPDIGPQWEWFPDPTGTIQGLVTGDSLPSYCSGVISIQTTRGGKSGRGRMYIAGIPEAGTVGSFLSPEAATWLALVAFVGCIASHFGQSTTHTNGDWVFGVLSRKLGNPKPPYTVAQFAQFTLMKPSRALGTTRSRKVGRGS